MILPPQKLRDENSAIQAINELYVMIERMALDARTCGYWEEDNKTCIYEKTLELLYGPEFFEWRKRFH